MDFKNLNLKKLIEIYVVANTADYLYRHYKSDTSIIQLAQSNDTTTLSSYISHSINPEISSIDLVYIYAVLIALSHKPANEVIPAMQKIDLAGLRWGKKLWSICKANFTSNLIVTIDLPQSLGKIETPIIQWDTSNIVVQKVIV